MTACARAHGYLHHCAGGVRAHQEPEALRAGLVLARMIGAQSEGGKEGGREKGGGEEGGREADEEEEENERNSVHSKFVIVIVCCGGSLLALHVWVLSPFPLWRRRRRFESSFFNRGLPEAHALCSSADTIYRCSSVCHTVIPSSLVYPSSQHTPHMYAPMQSPCDRRLRADDSLAPVRSGKAA